MPSMRDSPLEVVILPKLRAPLRKMLFLLWCIILGIYPGIVYVVKKRKDLLGI